MLLLNVLKPECEKRGLPVNTMEPERLAMLAIGVQYGLIDHHNARQKWRPCVATKPRLFMFYGTWGVRLPFGGMVASDHYGSWELVTELARKFTEQTTCKCHT